MSEIKKGYHITKKSNLYSIQKNGLQPRIGRRSNSVGEFKKLLCFSPTLYSTTIWKNRLYENVPSDDLAILTFDLSGVKYGNRYDSAGDFFTEDSIPPENISLVQIIEIESPQNIVSLEKPITELFFEKPILDSNKKREIIERLAEYEHKKWGQQYSHIEWQSHRNRDGSLSISDQDVELIQKYYSTSYEQVEEFYKIDIQKAIMESFFIMQDNGMTSHIGLSDVQLISLLEHIEYERRNRWSQHLLSICSIVDGKYIIPAEKSKLWKSEMRTPYNELSEELKELDRKEVYNIFLEIQNQTQTPLQKKEAELSRLEELSLRQRENEEQIGSSENFPII